MATTAKTRARPPTYRQLEQQVEELRSRVQALGGPYGAPEELVERYLDAGCRLWAARGRLQGRKTR